jgi:predicted phosphodiesterase
LNPGSTSLPKGGNPPTFGIYESATPGRAARFSVHHLESGKELAAVEIVHE